jgi:hypothetical protein
VLESLRMEPQHPALKLEFVAHFEVEIATPLEIGVTPAGRRRTIPITGGRFSGPRLCGEVLAGGADWLTVRPDRVLVIDTRYTLRTDDGALISIFTSGLGRREGDVIEIRQGLRFETAAPDYDWLMRSLFLASARGRDGVVRYDAYCVT